MYRVEDMCSGFLIPLAAIIILVLSVLVLSLSKIVGNSGHAMTQEAISLQAFYAAQSGVNYGMNRLFFPDDSRLVVDTNCNAFPHTLNFLVPGLNNCSSQIYCDVSINTEDTVSYYVLRSMARCGAGLIEAERVIEMTTFAD